MLQTQVFLRQVLVWLQSHPDWTRLRSVNCTIELSRAVALNCVACFLGPSAGSARATASQWIFSLCPARGCCRFWGSALPPRGFAADSGVMRRRCAPARTSARSWCIQWREERHLHRRERIYVLLTSLFVAALIAGDFIGGKFFSFAGRTFSAGIIPFPLTFVLTDVVNEFYGKEGARRLTYAGLVAAVFVWAVTSLALALPTVQDSPISDQAFRGAFGTSARLYVASLAAYLVGQLLDISIFEMLRKATGQRLLWLRGTGSTVLSQAIDSVSVSFVFLVGARPVRFIASSAANNYVGKLLMAVLLTPLIYVGHAVLRRCLGHYEDRTIAEIALPEPSSAESAASSVQPVLTRSAAGAE